MFHEQFEQQHVANSMENEGFELKNAANTVDMAASHLAPKCCKFHGTWDVRTQKCCKYRWNGTFQLQNAANSKENGQNRKSKNKYPQSQNGKKNKQFRAHFLLLKAHWISICYFPDLLKFCVDLFQGYKVPRYGFWPTQHLSTFCFSRCSRFSASDARAQAVHFANCRKTSQLWHAFALRKCSGCPQLWPFTSYKYL